MKRIALIGDNSKEYVEKLIEIWNNGDCAVLIDWRIPIDTAVSIMREAAVSICLIEIGLLNRDAIDKYTNIKFETFESSHTAQELSEAAYLNYKKNYSLNEAVIIFSSGTTGNSKGVILSHYAITSNADAISDYLQLNNSDCFYMAKTISHLSSITGELLVSLMNHTRIVIGPVVVPPRVIMLNIEKYLVTRMCINPTILRLMLEESLRKKYNLSSLKEVYIHGAHTDATLGDRIRSTIPNCKFYYEYGLSEAGPRVTSQKVGFSDINSVGKEISGVSTVIISDHGAIAAPFERGVIHVSTQGRYSGYVSGLEKYPSKYQGWLNSGDIGYKNVDGDLFVCGRVDDIINIDAHKIYPSDIEDEIVKFTGISECIVDKIEIHGRSVLFCFYVGNKINQLEVVRYLRARLLPYEIPKLYLKTDEIPKNRNGKVNRIDIRNTVTNKLRM